MKIRKSFQKHTKSSLQFTVPNFIEDLLNEYDEMTIALNVTPEKIDVVVVVEDY